MMPWFDIWADSLRTSRKLAETWVAANAVIGVRVPKMVEAAREPVTGDYAELGRMVPEKVEAFTRAGTAVAADVFAWQLGAMTTWTAFATRMQPPTAKRLRVSARRANRIAAKALDPIHRAATGNARRLKGRKSK